MELSQLGSIGEFVGAIAVVLSLFYVGFQIRQNTKAARAAAVMEQRKIISTFSEMVMQPGAVEVFLSGREQYPELPAVDAVKFELMMTNFFNAWEVAYMYEQNGVISRADSVDWSNLAANLKKPGVQRWWDKNASGVFSRSFNDFVNSGAYKNQ